MTNSLIQAADFHVGEHVGRKLLVAVVALQAIDESRLEKEALEAYRLVAPEYYDGRHMTCRAFDYLDEEILERYQEKYSLLRGGGRYLEVGGGVATLLRRVVPTDASLVVGDLCTEMAQQAPSLLPNMTYAQFSAFQLPFGESHFDGVFAFLADSYNVRGFYKEAWRLLRPGGVLLMTCPTRVWAATLRQGNGELPHYARFTTKGGRVVFIPSITWTREEYQALLSSVGLTMVLYEEFGLPSDYPFSRIPNTIRIPARRLGTEPCHVPLVAVVMGRK